jgi:hypothetical protein
LIATDHVIYPESEQHCDCARVRAFFERADVMEYLEAGGIPCKEVLSRVDSLTDREIAAIAGRLDQIPEGAESTNYEFDGSLLAIIGLAIYAIFMAMAIYFSKTMDDPEKPEQKESNLNSQLSNCHLKDPGVQRYATGAQMCD